MTFRKPAPEVNVISAPLEITSLRERKLQAGLTMLRGQFQRALPSPTGLVPILCLDDRISLEDRCMKYSSLCLIQRNDVNIAYRRAYHRTLKPQASISTFNAAMEVTVTARVDEVSCWSGPVLHTDWATDNLMLYSGTAGIGLEDHKAPYFQGGSDDASEARHAFSNARGVYIEDKVCKVGIRLEDCFYINQDGDAVYLTAGAGGQENSQDFCDSQWAAYEKQIIALAYMTFTESTKIVLQFH
ncbi:hypothetical protein EDC04DRAFT_2600477 [Pisolithus marmoratus]|nr:hypothetical protein EDC04DRAFT_2600477 [Pisolithus marmoratus]